MSRKQVLHQLDATHSYLGVRIALVIDHKDGWATMRWPDGKVWRHWFNQCEAI
jgi:hypothetical protein